MGMLDIVDSTIANNAADNSGGGIYNAGTLEVLNSTVSTNSATIAGGGFYNEGDATVRNATIALNTVPGGTIAGFINLPSASLFIANTGVATGAVNALLDSLKAVLMVD